MAAFATRSVHAHARTIRTDFASVRAACGRVSFVVGADRVTSAACYCKALDPAIID